MRRLIVATLLAAFPACTSLPGTHRPARTGRWSHAEASPTTSLVPLGGAARRWRLLVERETPSMASLRGDRDHVLVWSAPSGAVVVNGKRLSDNAIHSEDGRLLLPRDLVERVAGLLGSSDRAPPTAGPARTSPRLTGRTVMIDAGHGGQDPGAPNRWGPPEKDINLDTALRLQKRLAGWGARVLMTRTGDTFPSLDQRVAAANRDVPDLFVSLHSNSEAKGTARGFTIYAGRSASRASVRASSRLISALSAAGIPSRGLQRADFRVVSRTRVPALLIEMGFLTNPSEARLLSTAAHRQRLADAIARGIADALCSGAGPPVALTLP